MAWSPEDVSVLVHASIWALFAVATVFISLRFYSRLRQSGVGLKADDWVLLAGWIFVLLASGNMSWLVVTFMAPKGTLKITLARVHHNLQTIALGVTKTSFGITLLRLMPGGWEAKLIWGLIITMNLQFAVHIIASWQAICGADDPGHIGSKCWNLDQSVTFTVFSAVYSAVCDFVLALLPWKMIFNLQMKQSERLSIALALSMGVVAGITGIMKAYYGYKLLDVRSTHYLYNQAVYWIWSMAEPNVTIISASIPVLRGFVRNVRNRSNPSYPGAASGPYARTGDSSSKFYNRSTVTAQRGEPKDDLDGGSDSSILGRDAQRGDGMVSGGGGGGGGGITWTTEVSVEYEPRPVTARRDAKDAVHVDEFEMGRIRRGSDSAGGSR